MLNVQALAEDEIRALVASGILPPGLPPDSTVIGVGCEHVDRPSFEIFVPPAAASLAALVFGGPGVEMRPLTLLEQKRKAVESFSLVVTCECADAFWMRHGPAYPLRPGISHMDAEVCLHVSLGDRRTSNLPAVGH